MRVQLSILNVHLYREVLIIVLLTCIQTGV